MTIEQRAEAFAMAYGAAAEHTGEDVHEWHLKAAVEDFITAAVLDDRAERPELKTAIADERAAIAEMLAVEARRLRGLSQTAAVNFEAYILAADICERMEALIRARSAIGMAGGGKE